MFSNGVSIERYRLYWGSRSKTWDEGKREHGSLFAFKEISLGFGGHRNMYLDGLAPIIGASSHGQRTALGCRPWALKREGAGGVFDLRETVGS